MQNNTTLSRSDAQKRIDRIDAFYHELETLEKEHLFSISPAQQDAVKHYHQGVIASLVQQFDVDTTRHSKNLSLGMQIASFIGALALAASLFFLFYQCWGYLSTTLQVAILIASPFITLLLTVIIRSHEQTGYFSKLMALASFSCFVLDLSMLGKIFNIFPSYNAMAIWCAYSLLLAYIASIRLLLVVAIIFFYGFIAARINTWSGIYWLSMFEHPESFLLPALMVFFLPSLFSQRQYHGFDNVYRVSGVIGLLATFFILSVTGDSRYLPWPSDSIGNFYVAMGFVSSAGCIYLGIKNIWPAVTNAGNVFFVAFLYLKIFDWWWGIMPHFLFFLIISLTALLFMVIFNRLRIQLKSASAPGVMDHE